MLQSTGGGKKKVNQVAKKRAVGTARKAMLATTPKKTGAQKSAVQNKYDVAGMRNARGINAYKGSAASINAKKKAASARGLATAKKAAKATSGRKGRLTGYAAANALAYARSRGKGTRGM